MQVSNSNGTAILRVLITDRVQPELKAAVANVAPYTADWYGFAVSIGEPLPQTPYAARARVGAGWRMELADITCPTDLESYAR